MVDSSHVVVWRRCRLRRKSSSAERVACAWARQVMSVDYLLIYTRRSTSVLILYYSFRHNANELAKYRERHSTDNAPCSRSTVELFYYPFSIAISYFKCHLFDGEAGGSIWSSVYCRRGDVTAVPSCEARFGNFTTASSTCSQQFIHRRSEDHCQLRFIYAMSIHRVNQTNIKAALKD